MNYTKSLPRWIPEKVKNFINQKFLDIENFENEIAEMLEALEDKKKFEVLKKLEEEKKNLDQKWQFIRIIFESGDLKSDWEKLATYPEEDLLIFTSQIFDLPHNWKEKLAREKEKEKHEKNIRRKINKLIKAKKDLEEASLNKGLIERDAWEIVESRLQESLFEMDKKRDPNYADCYFYSFTSPVTRKRNVGNAHAIYCMRYLSLMIRTIFRKPLTEMVVNFINAIFETTYTYNDVVGHIRDINTIRERLNDVTIPFASTVDHKSGKIKFVDSKA